jgi:hypothetical protein
MRIMRTMSLLLGLTVSLPALAGADVRATVMMQSGERIAGNLEALDGGVLFVRESQNNQRRLPFAQVAVIDLVGDASGLPETELREARGSDHLLLQRDGHAVKGRLLDIEGGRGTSEGVAASLTFIFRTSSGEERRLGTDRIARLYLGNYPDQSTSSTPSTAEPASPPAAGVVRVMANQRWVDTGLTVVQGQMVTFDGSGEVRLSSDTGDVAGVSGARSGRKANGAPLPDLPAGALIGRVGNGPAFGIGNQTVPLSMPASGRLYLTVNDDEVGDNRGSFDVRVTADTTRNSRPGRRRP